MSWVYRVGLGMDEVSEDALKKSGFTYQLVEVEEALREHIAETIGKPYKLQTSMREDAPEFFSCSSLISYLYLFAGVWMPSLTWEKFEYFKKISKEDLRFGDLVYSHHGRLPEKSVDHIGMYLGDGRVLHALGTADANKVIIESLEQSVTFKNPVGYTRVVDDLKEKRYVVEIPENRPDLRSGEALLKELAQS